MLCFQQQASLTPEWTQTHQEDELQVWTPGRRSLNRRLRSGPGDVPADTSPWRRPPAGDQHGDVSWCWFPGRPTPTNRPEGGWTSGNSDGLMTELLCHTSHNRHISQIFMWRHKWRLRVCVGGRGRGGEGVAGANPSSLVLMKKLTMFPDARTSQRS